MITLNIHQREARLLERVAELEKRDSIQIENYRKLFETTSKRIAELEAEANDFLVEVIVKQKALYLADVLMDIIMVRTRSFPDILGDHLELWNSTQDEIKQALIRRNEP